jgi:type I restriction enzyme S subunit
MKRIGDVSRILSGGTPRKNIPENWGGSIPWFSAANMHEKYLERSDINLTEAGLDSGSRIAPEGSTLLLVRGSGLFNHIPICFAKSDVAFNQDVKAFVPDEHTDPLFFHYWLESMRSKLSENLGVTGIGAGKFDTDFLRNLPFPDLPRSKQEEIGRVAALCDDKIDLNRRMAATLEEMARALYRSWFVDFDPVKAKAEGLAPAFMDEATAALFPDRFEDGGLPEGWRRGRLSDVASLNPEKWGTRNAPETIVYVDLSNTKWGVIEATTTYSWSEAPSRARMVLRPGDTIVGTVRPGNGSFAYVAETGLTGSTGFAVLRPNRPNDAALVNLAATDPENIAALANLADGGAYPAVRPDIVGASEVIIAPEMVRDAFAAQVTPIVNRMEEAKRESRSLAALRDILLPKLMSGELRVGEARDQIEEVA